MKYVNTAQSDKPLQIDFDIKVVKRKHISVSEQDWKHDMDG